MRSTRTTLIPYVADVHIPSGFQIGLDIEHDRKRYPVSSGGVLVVNETPRASRPTVMFVAGPRKTVPKRAPIEAAA